MTVTDSINTVFCFLFYVWKIFSLTGNRKLSFQVFGLVDEHIGNVVLDFVQEPALVADEAVFLFREAKISFALGAGQDFKQDFADGHGISS
jgi:hypothetical protein